MQNLKFSRSFLTLALLALAAAMPAASARAATPRILLLGDSWLSRAWDARVFRTALQNRGLGQFEEKGDLTALGGTKAAQWAQPAKLALITSELVSNPEIDIVHMSLGINDYGFAPPGTNLPQLLAEILADIQTIVDHILSVRPHARIVWASYDYIPMNLNPETAVITQELISQALSTPNFYVLNAMGVLHHAFGYPPIFGPGERPLPGSYPGYVPLQGGDPAYPGSLDYFDDTVHPTTQSLLVLAEYAVDEFYADFLAPPVPTLKPPAAVLLVALLTLAATRGNYLLARSRG